MVITLKQIQEKLSEAIRLSGLTQTEIANKLNINQSNISCYIKGTKVPSLETFANLCAIILADSNDILCIGTYND